MWEATPFSGGRPEEVTSAIGVRGFPIASSFAVERRLAQRILVCLMALNWVFGILAVIAVLLDGNCDFLHKVGGVGVH